MKVSVELISEAFAVECVSGRVETGLNYHPHILVDREMNTYLLLLHGLLHIVENGLIFVDNPSNICRQPLNICENISIFVRIPHYLACLCIYVF